MEIGFTVELLNQGDWLKAFEVCTVVRRFLPVDECAGLNLELHSFRSTLKLANSVQLKQAKLGSVHGFNFGLLCML